MEKHMTKEQLESSHDIRRKKLHFKTIDELDVLLQFVSRKRPKTDEEITFLTIWKRI